MKVFFGLNIMSALYALALLIHFQLMGNIYRFVRISDLSFSSVILWVDVFCLIIFIISTIAFFFITKKYFNQGKIRFLQTILCVPHFIFFILISNFLFPIPRGEEPPVLGLLFILVFFIYPFYIAFINLKAPNDNSL